MYKNEDDFHKKKSLLEAISKEQSVKNDLEKQKFEETNDEFYADKITLSNFYMEQLLPLASGYTSSIKAGKDDLYKIKSENF